MNKLIFFVDDDKMILHLLEYTFSNRDNYRVKSFKNGEGCLNCMNEKPSLIVLDHSFLGQNTKFISGLDILKEIRKIDSYVPIILLSGETNQNIINEYSNNGVDKFIIKDSFFIDSLIESIEKEFSEII